jgi:PBSX family phage terminase large subunit
MSRKKKRSGSLIMLKEDNMGARYYECPLCSAEVKVETNVFYGVCPACRCTIIDYKPAPYQEKFHQSKAQYKLNIGGFGSGKTTMCCAELAEHILSTPHGRSLITAPKLQQVRDAVITELDKFLPPHLIAKRVNSPNIRYNMKNGHEVLVYASNDEENLRSINLTAFYVEEASNIDYKIFEQLQARLRNRAAVIFDENGREIDYKFLGMVSTNPDDGWVREKFLLLSGKIFASESIDRTMYDKIRAKNGEPQYHSFLSSSRDNTHLPQTFIQRLCIGKTQSWIRKYVDCYLDIREGAVYADFPNNIVEPFPVPKSWMRIAGFDKGYRDETAMLMGAIDPRTGTIYIYDEYYEKERPMSYHANRVKEIVGKYHFYNPIQADPSIRNRNERDGETYQSYFNRVSGIYLHPGNNDIDTGIDKVRDYLYLNKIKIFSTLEYTKREASNYVYIEDKDKPLDKANHLMDCLRYMIAPLPQDPNDFNSGLIQQSTVIKDLWKESWKEEDDDVVSFGNVYMLKGGISNGFTD